MTSQHVSKNLNLDKQKKLRRIIADHLNDVLIQLSSSIMNLRVFHWNIKERTFFELHFKFE